MALKSCIWRIFCLELSIETREDVTNMAESKYKFERLTPTDDVDLVVYEEAIDYVFQNPDIKSRAPA